MKPFRQLLSLLLLLLLLIITSSCERRFNKPPEISDQQFSIEENSPANTVIGTVKAVDESGQALEFSIVSGNEDDAFKISQDVGVISVNNEDLIDYETNPSRVLAIMVTDEFGKASSAEITINITNVTPPSNGLILYMPFNGNTKDSSGYMNNGIDYTSGNYGKGVWGKALYFDGLTDFIELSQSLDGTQGLTFSFWLKTRGAQPAENNGTVICKYSMTGHMRSFQILSFGDNNTRYDNRLIAYFYNNRYISTASNDMCKSYFEIAELVAAGYNSTLYTLTDPTRLTLNTWTHCVVNLTTTELQIWLNGILCTKKTREYQSYFNTPDYQTYIGNCLASGDGSNNHFNGSLDELRVYSRGLSVEEIKILFKE
jgi:hypothetical protein